MQHLLSNTDQVKIFYSTIRRNQIVGTDGIADKGAGNFGAHDLYIGTRMDTSLFFNSRLYSLIISEGEETTTEGTNTEQYLAGKLGEDYE